MADLRGMKEEVYGTNRMVLNTETVVFTPWHIAQFKMAMFGFADFGLIGDNGNIFKNNFLCDGRAGDSDQERTLDFQYDQHPFGRSPE